MNVDCTPACPATQPGGKLQPYKDELPLEMVQRLTATLGPRLEEYCRTTQTTGRAERESGNPGNGKTLGGVPVFPGAPILRFIFFLSAEGILLAQRCDGWADGGVPPTSRPVQP